MNEHISNLEMHGYCVLRGVVRDNDVDYCAEYITHHKVNYNVVETFLDDVIFPTINSGLGYNLRNMKYRVSNKDNSNDASAFHRDLIAPYADEGDTQPIYTVLSYLDTASMELVPGSHRYSNMDYKTAVENINNVVGVELTKNDILIINAAMIHRGIFYKKSLNRRLIQCFDCIPIEKYDIYRDLILHLPCGNNCWHYFENMMIYISKIKPIINVVNTFNYFNVATGYSSDKIVNYLGNRGYKTLYFSSEANNCRGDSNKFIINRYIIRDDKILDWEDSDNKNIKFYLNIYRHILHVIFVIYILYLVYMILSRFGKEVRK